jgi:hypothetical protein
VRGNGEPLPALYAAGARHGRRGRDDDCLLIASSFGYGFVTR